MVIFNECRVDKEGKNLIIDASIEDTTYSKDVWIKAVIIDTEDTYIDGHPSDKYVYKHIIGVLPTTNLVKEVDDSIELNKPKNIKLKINYKELLGVDDLNLNMFFVYIEIAGVPTIDCPCCKDNKYHLAVAVNLYPIYSTAMKYVKELNNDCTIPKGFIDMILRFNALKLSIKTGNIPIAIKLWNKLLKNKGTVLSNRGCGCNGTY